MITVRFVFMTGIKQRLFRNAWLCGSWNGWIEMPMQEISANDGCPAFVAEATFADSEAGRTHHWGVRLDAPDAPHAWAINPEVHDADSQQRYREAALPVAGEMREERYYFTDCRRLGAQKFYSAGAGSPALRFSVWAPNAKQVETVFLPFYLSTPYGNLKQGKKGSVPNRDITFYPLWESETPITGPIGSISFVFLPLMGI